MKNYKLTINYNENDYCFEGQFHTPEEFLANTYSKNGVIDTFINMLIQDNKIVRCENIGAYKFGVRSGINTLAYFTAQLDSEEIPNTEAAYYANEFYRSVMGV